MKTISKLGLYGNAVLERVYCESCKGQTFVRRGKKVCCDEPVDSQPHKFVRMSLAEQKRRLPSPKERRQILASQHNLCLYCAAEFGTCGHRHGREIVRKACWDHLLPFSFAQNNKASNYGAACQVCNGIKSDRVFQTLLAASNYVEHIRRKKGYDW